jgi:AcrR family transcriptional regulator
MPNRATGITWDPTLDDDAPEMIGTRTTRGGLSTQAIVETAIAIADVDGLDAVSIRRVAAILEVRPMSLYTHIVSKDELLALMANELVGSVIIEDPLPADWREALTLIARRQFRMFSSHPWLLSLFARRPRHGPNAARQAKQLTRAVESLRLRPEDVWRLLGIVNDYVLGNAMRIATAGTAKDLVENLSAEDKAALPETGALSRVEATRLDDEGFELGLQTVLDGVERRFVTSRR